MYASVRVTNAAGLYTIAHSNGIVISPEPRLRVWDGPSDEDVDGQADCYVIQGGWSYSDPCPIVTAEWSVQDLSERMVVNFTTLPEGSRRFYNDLLTLNTFVTYVNLVRVRDALNRSSVAYSDGVTVITQRPDPATVRDGLGEKDQDFQEATDQLTGNWDSFGNVMSSLPSDHIVRYEAALGTDRRYATTRSDVHSFEDVGLSTNATFYGLHLTAKIVTYYVTVRAYSAAGSFVESSSDGIKVGYSADVTPGQVFVDQFQSSTSTIRFWWNNFVSDMVITHHYAGVSTSPPAWGNSTNECHVILSHAASQFDVSPLQSLENDAFGQLTGLSLTHGQKYYVTLVVENQMEQCSSAVSQGTLVDTTPPLPGRIGVDGVNGDTVIFLHSPQTVIVNLNDFSDPESGIKKTQVQLLSSLECNAELHYNTMTEIRSVAAANETRIEIRKLDLQEGLLYFLRVTVTNGASMETQTFSQPIILDTSSPTPGSVKLGQDWTGSEPVFQNETHVLGGMLAVGSISSNVRCLTEVDLFSPEGKQKWTALSGSFAADCAGFDGSDLHVITRHNPYLTGMDRGAAQYPSLPWREGDYKFYMSTASGKNILSGVALASPNLQPPFLVQNDLTQKTLSSQACNSTLSSCSYDTMNTSGENSLRTDDDCGIGFSFIDDGASTKALFWVQDKLQLKRTWISLESIPASFLANYVLRLTKRVENNKDSWETTLFVDGRNVGGFSGLQFMDNFVVSVYTWNIDEFLQPVVDPFDPFKAVLTLKSVVIPVSQRPLCSFGAAFQDHVSGVKEIWAGVSNSVNTTANVVPYRLVRSFCLPCLLGCTNICSACNSTSLQDDYKVFSISIDSLHLIAANEVINTSVKDNSTHNTTAAEMSLFRLPTYFLDIRVIDHSGLTQEVKSAGIIIDTSPPVINFFRCFDPMYSYEESIIFLGNNNSVGVTWDASEDISNVAEVWVCVGTQPGLGDIAPKLLMNRSADRHVFENMHGSLNEGEQYFATLEIKNEAGLSAQAQVNFTVHTVLPDLSALTLSPANATILSFSGQQVALVSDTKNLELNLQAGLGPDTSTDVEFYGQLFVPLCVVCKQ